MPTRKRSRQFPPRSIRRLPLTSLRVFVAAAEQLSFSRAAQAIGVTVAAVSMQIRALEEYLQLPLFVRGGRAVQLTGEGARLLPRIRSALAELERAVDEARRERHSGALTVSMLSSFLQQWLLPRLPDFQKRHSDVDLRIHTSASLVDFHNSDVQAAIRFGGGDWPQLHVQKLIDDWLVPVCTKDLAGRHGLVTTQDDLRRYPLLHSKSEPWEAWVDGRVRDEWAARGATFDDSVAVIRAAEAGQGLALGRWSLVSREVAEGRLVIASRKIVVMPLAYYFVCPASYLSLEKISVLREWLLGQAQSSPRPPTH
jgi:LysR family transcriptional regulator, glycine cleavage system transcriptional activator